MPEDYLRNRSYPTYQVYLLFFFFLKYQIVSFNCFFQTIFLFIFIPIIIIISIF